MVAANLSRERARLVHVSPANTAFENQFNRPAQMGT
jgi:hypothetical protein